MHVLLYLPTPTIVSHDFPGYPNFFLSLLDVGQSLKNKGIFSDLKTFLVWDSDFILVLYILFFYYIL